MFVTYDSKIHSRKVSQKGVMQKVPDIIDLYNKKCNISTAEFKSQNDSQQRGRSKPFFDIKLNLRKHNVTQQKDNIKQLNLSEHKVK